MRVVSARAYHSLFMYNMLIRPTDQELATFGRPDFTIFNAGTFLVDKSVHDWSPGVAIAAALGFLVAFWLVYDAICRTLGRDPRGDRVAGLAIAAPGPWVEAWRWSTRGMAVLAPTLAALRVGRAIRAGAAEAEFARWFRPEPPTSPA